MTRTTPGTPGTPGTPDSSPDRPPRRSRLVRTTTVAGVLVPLCLAGWLGWQAVADHGGTGDAAPATRGNAAAAAPDTGPAGGPAAPSGPTATLPADAPPATPPAGADPSAATPSAPGPSSAPAAPATPASTVLAGRTVLLDPGHNPGNFAHSTEINRQVDIGNTRKECDTTGTSTNAGYTEADYTLDVSRRARRSSPPAAPRWCWPRTVTGRGGPASTSAPGPAPRRTPTRRSRCTRTAARPAAAAST